MSQPDEVARKRAQALGHPSTFQRQLPAGAGPASAVTEAQLAALQRNRDAASRGLVAAYEALRAAHVRDADPDAAALVLLARDRVRTAFDRMEAASLRLEAAHAVRLAHRDSLTGCLSRDSGLEQLRNELDRASRQGTDLVVAFVDVDGLKQVNDTQGHLAGDAVLRALGGALTECLRSYDVVLRYGGDEFVCGLPGLLTQEARVRFDDVAGALHRRSPGARFTVGLTLAHGLDDVEAALARADADLYQRRRDRSVVPMDRHVPPRPGA